ncbi:MAG: MFS transporter [Chloroflexi bacterium]|nr:MFS transporter [Chloroflexota bacterium]MDA1003362.1 MFS transporter [Chloroflexota bacterium]
MTRSPRLRSPDENEGAASSPPAVALAPVDALPVTAADSLISRLTARTFDSLRDRGYRWFFLSSLGQMSSLNMQQLVRGFLVFELTGSYAALGTMYLVNSLPGLALSAAGGVLADRVREKKRLVQAGQLFNGANAFALALLIWTGTLRFEHLLIAAVVHGTVMSLMMPARQAMIPEVIGLDRLMNAVALNSAGMNTTRLLAPSVAGFMLAALGASWVYFTITGLYLFATLTLARVPSAPLARDVRAHRGGRRGSEGVRELRDGLRYMARDHTMRLLLVTAMVFAMLSMPYLFLLPGFVAGVLHEGPGKLGLLMTLTGVGSLAGSLAIAAIPPRGRGRLLIGSGVILAIGLIAFSASTWFWLTAAIMVVVGVGEAGRMSLSMVLVQAYADDGYRGRVMSVYMMQRSVATFGTFFVGLLAAAVGAPLALGGIAVMLLVLALAMFALPGLRDLD